MSSDLGGLPLIDHDSTVHDDSSLVMLLATGEGVLVLWGSGILKPPGRSAQSIPLVGGGTETDPHRNWGASAFLRCESLLLARHDRGGRQPERVCCVGNTGCSRDQLRGIRHAGL
jgi:hypothetical protein